MTRRDNSAVREGRVASAVGLDKEWGPLCSDVSCHVVDGWI